MKQAPHSPQISLFAQAPNYCAVRAPATTSRDIIETEVALRNRGIPHAVWKIALGPLPNPQTCPHDELRQHWLVMRVST